MKRDTILNVVLVLVGSSAVMLSGVALARSFRGTSELPAAASREVSNWRNVAAIGRRIGPVDAKVQIVEFFDFQCPSCRQVAADLHALRTRYEDTVAVILRHYPLEQIHPNARAAALASECAAQQGRFEAFSDAAFQGQDSLGRRSWISYARSASVSDIPAFTRCLRSGDGDAAILRDVATADSLGVRGTPALLVNGHFVLSVPSRRLLDSLVQVAIREH